MPVMMGRGLCDLPMELLVPIVAELDPRDVVMFSATCSGLREALAPYAFKLISFTNDESSIKSAHAAAKKYGQYTVEMQFAGTSRPKEPRVTVRLSSKPNDRGYCYEYWGFPDDTYMLEEEGDVTSWVPEESLSDVTRILLEGILTPNLVKFRLQTSFEFAEVECIYDQQVKFKRSADKFYYRWQQQASIPRWCAFNSAIWTALCANKCIRKLAVDNFLPKATPVFGQRCFHQLLCRLDEFDISFASFRSGTLQVSTARSSFLGSMGSKWFGRMKSLKTLRINSSESMLLSKTPIDGARMPFLEALELQGCSIGPEVINFISSHWVTIKQLSFVNCYSSVMRRHYSWENIFRDVLAMNLSLDRFYLFPAFERLVAEEADDLYPTEDVARAELRRHRRLKAAHIKSAQEAYTALISSKHSPEQGSIYTTYS